MKHEIMIQILFILLAKDKVSAKSLANRFEVTTRTIYRYIESLSLAGVPIETVRGADGGFRIRPSYKLSSGFLTEDEKTGAINALTAINAEIADTVLTSVINKLTALKKSATPISLKSGNLIIDAGPWTESDGYKHKLSEISYSADKCEILNIEYHDRNGEITVREIEPHTLVFKQGVWYVYAYCNVRRGFRFFKVARIGKLTPSGKTFIRRETPESLPFNEWFKGDNIKTVKFEVIKSVLPEVLEWLGVEKVPTLIDGKYYLEADLPTEQSLIMKILSFGKGIKVISPKSLKDDVHKTAISLAKLYE